MKTPLNRSLKYLLYFSLLVCTLSCSKENSVTTPSAPSIVGKWSLVSRKFDNIPSDKCEVGSVVTFNLNNSYTYIDNCDLSSTSGTYILSSNSLSLRESGRNEIKAVSFSVTGTTLTLEGTLNSSTLLEVYKRVI